MEIDNTINLTIIISSVIAILGWIVNNILKRRDEIAKKRLEYRLETLLSFMPIYKTFRDARDAGTSLNMDKELTEKINIAGVKFQLYGYQDEINLLQKFLDSINTGDQQALIILNELIELSKGRLRKELKLPELK